MNTALPCSHINNISKWIIGFDGYTRQLCILLIEKTSSLVVCCLLACLLFSKLKRRRKKNEEWRLLQLLRWWQKKGTLHVDKNEEEEKRKIVLKQNKNTKKKTKLPKWEYLSHVEHIIVWSVLQTFSFIPENAWHDANMYGKHVTWKRNCQPLATK